MVNRRNLLKLSALGTASFAAPLAYSASKITMAYNTGNPPGSSSPKDLIDNAEDFDYLLTGDGASHPNRLGVSLKSWKGMEGEHNAAQIRRESEFDADQIRHEQEFDTAQNRRVAEFNSLMESSGYSFVGDYGPDVLIERFSQYVMKDGQPYRLSSLASVPYTTTGDWVTERDAFVLLGDDVLRQQMANPLVGARLLAHKRGGVPGEINSVQEKLDAGYLDAGEYAYAITSRPVLGDPTTWDWAPAVEEASRALKATGSGGVICLPRLSPCRHTTIKLHKGVSLIGHGGGTHMLHVGMGNAFEWIGDVSGDTAPRQSYRGSDTRLSRVSIQNFISEGNPSSQNGFHLEYTEKFGRGNVVFRDMEIAGHGQDGIYWTFGDNLTLDNVFSLYNHRHGLHVFQNGNSMHVDGGSFTGNGARGIYLNQVASSCKIDGATVHDNATNGIYAQRCENPLIYNCQFNGNGFSTTQDHAPIAMVGDAIKSVEAGIIEGCLMGDNAPLGPDVLLGFTKSVFVGLSYAFNVNPSKPYIVRLGGESRGVVIRGTRWNNTAGAPLKVSVAPGQEANVDYILEDDEAQNSSTGMPDGTKRVDHLWNQFLEYRLRNPNNVLFQTRSTGSESNPFFLITGRGQFQWRRNGDSTNPLRSLGINANDEMEFAGRVRTDLGFVTNGSAWNDRPLRLGNFVIWVDATGRLMKKNGTPTSDSDGIVVGTES
jgi:parallel beta-helix repeat protein